MKRFKVFGLLLLILAFALPALAADMGQVTCNSSTATQIGPAGSTAQIFRSLAIQNQTPSVGVYVGPLSTITSSTGGILLSTTTGSAYVVDNPVETWYCITGSSTVTVGYIRR
jgi:hypothetical protein